MPIIIFVGATLVVALYQGRDKPCPYYFNSTILFVSENPPNMKR